MIEGSRARSESIPLTSGSGSGSGTLLSRHFYDAGHGTPFKSTVRYFLLLSVVQTEDQKKKKITAEQDEKYGALNSKLRNLRAVIKYGKDLNWLPPPKKKI
jgi:hypothetical protein